MTTPAPPDSPTVEERSSGRVYVPEQDLLDTIRIALACGRPLLLRGKPGTGKSTLARWYQLQQGEGWAFEEFVVTSRTRAADLSWTLDAVERLADAQAQQLQPIASYVREGPLARAYRHPGPGFVPLIDEIDKADPDVPNDLLVPLGTNRVRIEPTGQEVERRRDAQVLVVLTTNEERELPAAFLRRCVVYTIPLPDAGRLAAIARAHFPGLDDGNATKFAQAFVELRNRTHGRTISTAEFLDAIAAVRELGDTPEVWALVTRVALRKEDADSK
jgi:MoxR-like ATPase